MKDIDKLLQQHPHKPKRQLTATFTEDVMQKIKAKRGWRNMLSNVHFGHLSKAGALGLGAFLLVSGTVAAIALWPKPTVTQTDKKLLPSGNRIVSYNAENCIGGDQALDGTAKISASHIVRYEVRADSKLTDEQIKNSLRALCEEDVSNNAISTMVKAIGEKPGLQSTLAYTIKAIAPNKLTLVPDSHYDAATYDMTERTYTRFSDGLKVQNQATEIPYGLLNVGDTVKLIVQDTSGKSQETPDGTYVMTRPAETLILGILKMPALTGDPNVMYRAFATDLVRVEPCENSPTGFCRAYDFAQEFTPPAQ